MHFKSGGPIFLLIGGEGGVHPAGISSISYVHTLAEKFNGLLIYTEHRFYGKSMPFEKFSTNDLKYLSSDQALADLAHFVRSTITGNEKLNATSGVIAIGTSYSGSLAVWFRQEYPHLVNGVWASSAPLEAKVNFPEFMELVGNLFRDIGGEECYSVMSTAFKELNTLVENMDVAALNTSFGVCNDFNIQSKPDVWNFIDSIRTRFLFGVGVGR